MRIEFTFLFFCLDLVFVMSCAGTIRSQTFNLVEVVESVKERMYSIEKEIGDLGDHEWAGTYVRRFSVDSFITLRLAPNSGAAFQFQENSGVVSQGFAKLAVKDSGLTLTWEQATVPLESLSTELIVVQFRSNVFLVPPREVHGFCLERHSDNMPRSYFSSKRRLAIRETSDIALPEEYRKFEDLPATVARVIQADEAQLFRSGEAVWGVQLAILV